MCNKVIITPINKVCTQCKYFRNNHFLGPRYGKCLRFGEQNMIDGTIRYENAYIAKTYDCKGDYFEGKEDITKTYLNVVINKKEDSN